MVAYWQPCFLKTEQRRGGLPPLSTEKYDWLLTLPQSREPWCTQSPDIGALVSEVRLYRNVNEYQCKILNSNLSSLHNVFEGNASNIQVYVVSGKFHEDSYIE